MRILPYDDNDDTTSNSNKRESMDFPESPVANIYRLLENTKGDIIIEFGKATEVDSNITIVASVKLDRKLALALSSSIKDKHSCDVDFSLYS